MKDHRLLWIAFILYLWRIEHSMATNFNYYDTVVNCFHFVSLTYWTQLFSDKECKSLCCELLSFCIFDVLNTAELYQAVLNDCCELLSFCIFDVLNTAGIIKVSFNRLLWIAFILYLWRIEHSTDKLYCITSELWIAFILYLWRIEHSQLLLSLQLTFVVNCFHFVSLTYWTQPSQT